MSKQIISRGGITNKKMLIYNSQSFISPIARQYFAKVNALNGDVQDKKAINDFTIGVSRIIDPTSWACWPLISSQSVGTGTIAPSLGLLGNFNGTLTNGPTWGNLGINFVDSSSQSISTSLIVPSTPFTLFAVGLRQTSGSSGDDVLIAQPAGNGALAMNYRFSTSRPAGRVVISSSIIANGATGALFTNDAYQSWATTHDGVNLITYQAANLTSSVSAPGLKDASNTPLFIGSGPTGFWNGVISFAFICYTSLNPVQLVQMVNIYKLTLGQGLGLP